MRNSRVPVLCIDRLLQGNEFAQRLRERNAPIATDIFLPESQRPTSS